MKIFNYEINLTIRKYVKATSGTILIWGKDR